MRTRLRAIALALLSGCAGVETGSDSDAAGAAKDIAPLTTASLETERRPGSSRRARLKSHWSRAFSWQAPPSTISATHAHLGVRLMSRPGQSSYLHGSTAQ